MSLASISSTVQGLFGSRGRRRSHRGSLGGEEEDDVALSLAGNSSAIPATFSDSFHSTPCHLFRFFLLLSLFSSPTSFHLFLHRFFFFGFLFSSFSSGLPFSLKPAVMEVLKETPVMEADNQRGSVDLLHDGDDPITFLVSFCDNNLHLCIR